MNESTNRPAERQQASAALAEELATAAAALTAYLKYRQDCDERRRRWKVATIVFFVGLITSACAANWLTRPPKASTIPHPVATRCASAV